FCGRNSSFGRKRPAMTNSMRVRRLIGLVREIPEILGLVRIRPRSDVCEEETGALFAMTGRSARRLRSELSPQLPEQPVGPPNRRRHYPRPSHRRERGHATPPRKEQTERYF